MMGEKTKSFDLKYIAILSFALVLILFTLAGATLSRYVSEDNAEFEDEIYLDFTVNAVFEVRNQIELFAAINQGYSYIRLADDIENPLIVTQKAETLDSDLILDLNGIEIQRNGYDPILNIKKGVRLTIVDTSESGRGGLYNPVGSVFAVQGGALTVATGKFESGPRYSEYVSYNTNIVDDDPGDKRTIVLPNAQPVSYYGSPSDSSSSIIYAPIIKSFPEPSGSSTYVHGNLYFDEGLSTSDITGSQLDIPIDTYCYYRTSKDIVDMEKERIQLTCDWFYSYWVDPITYDYRYAVLPEGESADDYLEISIYGYKNVFDKVLNHENYNQDGNAFVAAVEMTSGALEVQRGTFLSYFGLDNTACVYATGGTISIADGKFSTRIPNAISRVDNQTDNSLSAKEDDSLAFGTDYFNRYLWNTADEAGRVAMRGEGYCILNSGDAVIEIKQGDFYSSNNNVIKMEAGDLSVGGGTMQKQTNKQTADTSVGENTACILMLDGTLDVGKAVYTITGDYNAGILMYNGTLTVHQPTCNITGKGSIGVYINQGTLSVNTAVYNITGDASCGIAMNDGMLTISDASFSIDGNDTYGIYAAVSGDNNFILNNASFALTGGDRQIGIFANNGRVQLTSETSQSISLSGANSYGIKVEDVGSVLSNGYSYSVGGANSFGIHSSGTGNVNVSDGNITMGGATSSGIFSETGPIDFNDGNIVMSGNSSNGIHSVNATINMSGGNMSLTGTTSKGIYSTGGNITMTGGEIALTSNQTCYGVYAASDLDMQVSLDGTNVSVGYGSTAGRTSGAEATVGVFLQTANLKNKITLVGASIKSHEVGILLRGGSLDVKGSGGVANITTEKASSIIVLDGDLTFDASCNYNISSSTTNHNSTANSYNITLPNNGGTATAYPNTDGVYVSGGDFTSNGTANISHSGLINDIGQWTYFDDVVINSYAVRVLGGSVMINKGSITSNVGGGLCCNGGNVTLGNASSQKEDITIRTTGAAYNGSNWVPIYGDAGADVTWTINKTTTGGHAVEVIGGSLIAYNGTYSAAFGDGIKLNAGEYTAADEANNVQRTTVQLHNGEFSGRMGAITGKSGPGSSYGLKVFGPAIIDIYNGVFDGTGGGACVSGVYDYNVSGTTQQIGFNADYLAEVYIYEGQFGSEAATDGFMIYDYSKIIFGAYTGEQLTAKLAEYADAGTPKTGLDLVGISATKAPFSINWLTFKSPHGINDSYQDKSCDVRVYYGDYYGGFAGWNKSGNASAVIFYNYNLNNLATYNITGSNGESVQRQNNTTPIYYSGD